MHILTGVYTDPKNHEEFPKWINSLDYGSRPFCREFRFYDIAISEKNKDKLLAELKWYSKEKLVGMTKKKTQLIQKMIKFVMKIFRLKPVDMDNIEKIPEKWRKPMTFVPGCTHGLYLFPIGTLPDRKDEHGHEEI